MAAQNVHFRVRHFGGVFIIPQASMKRGYSEHPQVETSLQGLQSRYLLSGRFSIDNRALQSAKFEGKRAFWSCKA